ncbi:hypothetical protein LDFHOB_04370 [Candidatus Electronema aureum]
MSKIRILSDQLTGRIAAGEIARRICRSQLLGSRQIREAGKKCRARQCRRLERGILEMSLDKMRACGVRLLERE